MRFERYIYILSIPVFALVSESQSEEHVILTSKITYILLSLVFNYELVIKGTYDIVNVPLLTIEKFPAFFAF